MEGWLTGQAYAELLYADVVRQRGFKALRELLRRTPVRQAGPKPANEIIATVTRAVSTASMIYYKQIYCLQRSVVVTRLLRRRGVDARLVIGCRVLPLASHAWVVVGQEVISDGLYDLAHFRILDQW